MKTLHTISFALVIGLAAALASGFGVVYDLSWHTIDGGGGTSSGGGFTLSGTIGQPDAGAMSGGPAGDEYVLIGGFWAGVAESSDPAPTCPADLTGSGSVGVPDLLVLLGAWGPCPSPCPADLTGSGSVGVPDLLVLLGVWGPCP